MSKTFLITGASAGLGSIFAESIANIARNIIIVGRDQNRLIKLSSKLKKINSKIHVLIITTDLSKENGVLTIFRKFESQKKIRFVDVVLNSAANFTVKKIEQISFEQLKKDFQLNVISPFLISKYFGL